MPHKAAANADSMARSVPSSVNSENTNPTDSSVDEGQGEDEGEVEGDSGGKVYIVVADEHVADDYEADNSADARIEVPAAAAHIGRSSNLVDFDVTSDVVDGLSQMSHLHRPMDESVLSDNDKLHYEWSKKAQAAAGESVRAAAVEPLKIETKSTELENASGKDTDTNNNVGDEADDDDDEEHDEGDENFIDVTAAVNVANMANVNWVAGGVEADAATAAAADPPADMMAAVVNDTKPNTQKRS